MNKLQKLSESGIGFMINFNEKIKKCEWTLNLPNFQKRREWETDLRIAIRRLWAFAKKYYPDAPCFKEGSNG